MYNSGVLPLGLKPADAGSADERPGVARRAGGAAADAALHALEPVAILLPIPLALCLLVHGLLGAPLYTALLLHAHRGPARSG